jgi:multicomponent Na+:H+ antiporter subunit D
VSPHELLLALRGMDALPIPILLSSLIPGLIIAFLGEGRTRIRRVLNLGGAGVKLALVGVMLWGVAEGERYEWRLTVLPGLELSLVGDSLALLFITLSAVLWLVTTIYAIGYLEGSPNRNRFFSFFSLCVTATVGIAFAGDLFTFIIFYEALTWATYPLVVHRGSEAATRAGRIYLIYTVVGGTVLLFGIVWLYALSGTVTFVDGGALAHVPPEQYAALTGIFLVLLAGVGVKAALVPLHGWLPTAMVAPAPVSALLHAVAVVKAGAFGIVRILYSVFGIELSWTLGMAYVVIGAASVTILYGSLRALYQDDLKRRLAFSTVSQVSYIALGTAMSGPLGAAGGLVHLVHQGLMKITLFFCAGNLSETHGISRVSEMAGIGRRMPWTMAAFSIGALGMIGLPPIAGFISKWYLGVGAIEAGLPWVIGLLVASSLLNAAYFLPILKTAWLDPHPDAASGEGGGSFGIREAAPLLLLPTLATAALSLGAGVLAEAEISPLRWVWVVVDRVFGLVPE